MTEQPFEVGSAHDDEWITKLVKNRVGIWLPLALVLVGFALMPPFASTALADPVSVTVDSNFVQRSGATVTIKDQSGKTVKTGTTAVPQGGGRPKFQTDLAPGTYTVEASWLNARGRTETGTMTYTVTGGKNEPNVVVAENGYQNPPGSGTSARAGGVTVTGRGGANEPIRYDSPSIGPINLFGRSFTQARAALDLGAHFNSSNGIGFLPEFRGGNATGVNGIDEDADFVGISEQLKVGMGTDMPDTGPGVDRAYLHARARHSWGESVFKADRITARVGSNFDINGINLLPAIATNQVDDVEARSEIETYEFGLAMGFVFGFGPIGNYTIGNMIFGNLGNIGNVGSADRDRDNNLSVTTEFEALGGNTKQKDSLGFSNAGNENLIKSELDSDWYGGRARLKFGLPVAPGMRFMIGPTLGVVRYSTDLSATQVRGANNDSATDSDSQWSYSVGVGTGLSVKWAIGTLGVYANYAHLSKSPFTHYSNSNTDQTVVGWGSSDQGEVGFRLTKEFSDIRLKTDIVRIGFLPSGLPVYTFRYIGLPETHIGVMAQEAKILFPEAVGEVGGYLTVDYSKIR